MTEKEPDKVSLAKVIEAVKSIDYGTVQVVIHDSHVVQIEKTEKIRVRGQSRGVCS